ncbi:hypothetical protein EJ02DRAFT_503076 [Clathrospora elynae]|uniref:Ubiquitin-like domain-containing protein n=1 Tax=Clathrospora elynae TaxID=706981 RepID=A0A6A5SQW2_9PLEO|nr:hypothetical protein EJ02DRAFT_503076 [Clathrospora elynae]
MSELAFCKSFLSALDARPVKLSSDHIADARQYPAQGVYTLPRLPPPHPQRPNPKPSASDDASSPSTAISISLKPMKPTTPTIPLSGIDPRKTSIYDLKQQYASQTSIPAAKIKILYKKKPVIDSKTVADVVGTDAGAEVEFGVMVMGGGVASPSVAGTPVTSPPAVAPTEGEKGLNSASAGETSGGAAAVGPSGKELVATDEFWGDLKNFVLQRIKDEAEGERLVGVFKSAWEQSK